MKTSLQTKQRSFWSRPEGTTGMLALAGGGLGLYFALPTLITIMAGLAALLGHTVAVVALSALLGAMLYVLTNRKFLTLTSYIFKSAMRKITGVFVEIDPIGIMKSYRDDLVDKRETMAKSRDKLKGQITVLGRKIEQNNAEYSRSMLTAKTAKETGNNSVLSVSSRQAGRMEKLNKESLVPLYSQLEIHLRALNKYYEVTGTVIEDLGNEIQARQINREMITSSYSAMRAAKDIMMGGTDQKELYDQALEFVVQDFGMKLGEIDSFMENSRGFVESLDMQNGVYEAEALKKLQEWEKGADSILLGQSKIQLLEQSHANAPITPVVTTVDYSSLLNSK